MRLLDSPPRSTQREPMPGANYGNHRDISHRDRINGAFACNHLLAALPDKEMARLSSHLEFVYLESGQEICREDEKSIHVYFPTTAIIAMLHRGADGSALEIGAIGCEGMVGAVTFLESASFGAGVVQFEGGAYRTNLAAIEHLCDQGGYLQQLMMQYTWAFLSQVLQSSMSGRHWSVEQRLSCWLLERLDRLPTNELKTTQETIAGMLGVRRESITESVGKLRWKGMVRCRRGVITVLDRDGLERLAGECYRGKTRPKSLV